MSTHRRHIDYIRIYTRTWPATHQTRATKRTGDSSSGLIKADPPAAGLTLSAHWMASGSLDLSLMLRYHPSCSTGHHTYTGPRALIPGLPHPLVPKASLPTAWLTWAGLPQGAHSPGDQISLSIRSPKSLPLSHLWSSKSYGTANLCAPRTCRTPWQQPPWPTRPRELMVLGAVPGHQAGGSSRRAPSPGDLALGSLPLLCDPHTDGAAMGWWPLGRA